MKRFIKFQNVSQTYETLEKNILRPCRPMIF